MKRLWIVVVVLATYVSIYPFNFEYRALDSGSLRLFLDPWRTMVSRGDILGNVVLFIPFGVLGMLAAKPGTRRLRRFLFVCLLGTLFAFVLQVAQLYLPSRDENLQDVLWNLFGTVAGAGGGAVAGGFLLSSADRARRARLVPLALIASWLFFRLAPFVPSIDLQSVKDSLKPLLLHPELSPVLAFRDAVAWLVIGFLLRYCLRERSLSRYLPILILAVLSIEVLIIHNQVSASDVLGGLVAALAWFVWLRRVRRPAGLIAGLMLLMLVVVGLTPFELREYSTSFSWLPFKGYLGGSMWLNTQSAFEKFFYYGSVVYLLRRAAFHRILATAIGFLVLLFVEFAQMFLVGHSSEITDPLLIVMAAVVIAGLEKQERYARNGSRDRSPLP